MTALRQFFGSPATLRGLALASLIGNVVIVITGGAVRLTGSGLGCPTWPRCVAGSYVPESELGIHGAIEFGNRMITFVVGLLAVLVLASAWLQRPRRRGPLWWAVLVLVGIPVQAVIGGITVRTNLNPWLVGLHFLASVGLVITAAYFAWARSLEVDGPPRWLVPVPMRALLYGIVAASLAVVAVGVVVTGSGPHAGDARARRTGLSPGSMAQLHADLVFLLLGLTIAAWLAALALAAARAGTAGPTDGTGAGARDLPHPVVRAAAVLLVVELAQGVIGFVQYFTHLPEVLVAAHMGGACVVWVATLALLHAARRRSPVPVSAGQTSPAPRSTPAAAST